MGAGHGDGRKQGASSDLTPSESRGGNAPGRNALVSALGADAHRILHQYYDPTESNAVKACDRGAAGLSWLAPDPLRAGLCRRGLGKRTLLSSLGRLALAKARNGRDARQHRLQAAAAAWQTLGLASLDTISIGTERTMSSQVAPE